MDATLPAAAGVYGRSVVFIKGTSAAVPFVLRDATDGSLVTAGTPVCYITKDGGAQATTTNSATHLGNGQWTLTLTGTEMTAEVVGLLVTESGSTPIEVTIAPITMGSGGLPTNTDVAAIKVKTDFLPSATAGAAGGVLIAGANAATTFSTITSTGAFTVNGSTNLRADLQQILGSNINDTGAGATFGDNLANNFSVLFGSTRSDGVGSIGVGEISLIKTRTDRIPNVAAGDANGLLIAGANAATTFATLTSTGAFTVNGTVNLPANVTQFGGTNGTFSGGRAEVNASHWGGTAVASANVRADLRQIIGNTLTDTGGGAFFGDNLANNFSVLFGSTRSDGVGACGVGEIGLIKTRTDRIPNVTAGTANGLQICGANAATTYATLTVTGAMSVNGVSNVSQTGDSYARIGSTGSGLTTLATASALSAVSGNVTSTLADTGNLVARLTLARAGYLDNLNSGGAVATANSLSLAASDIVTLLSRLTSTRAGYLDNLSAGAVATAASLSSVAGTATSTLADTATLVSRLTSTRAGYLDKLNIVGDVASVGDLTAIGTNVSTVLSRTPNNKPTVSVDGTMNASMTRINGFSQIDGLTPAEAIAVIAAVAAGKISGSSSNSPIIRSADDSYNRVTATTNQYGDRLGITLNLTNVGAV
jgi:hypothetical protein